MADLSETADEPGWETGGFAEFRSNLDYARNLVKGGRHLERLQVGAFDVADLYRAAWVQAVSALDHWVHRELYDRALAFALDASAQRPPKFLKLRIPLSLFEDVQNDAKKLPAAFAGYLRDQFGWQSFQAPEKIREALSHVSDVPLWPSVATWLTDRRGETVSAGDVQDALKKVVERRNRIAHEADRDPARTDAKQSITADEASNAIAEVETVATAIIRVIGPPAATVAPAVEDDSEEGTGSVKEELYRRFWTRFTSLAQRRGWSNASPPTVSWFSMPAGVTGANWVVSFTRFGCRSELFFGDPDAAVNLNRWQALADRRGNITERFGDGLIFDDLPTRKGCRIETRLLGPTVDDEDHWSDVLRWMEDTQTRLRAAIGAVPR
ncbi:DUF4268 domain-containing protein [Amycolatopsis sp. NPDC003865]